MDDLDPDKYKYESREKDSFTLSEMTDVFPVALSTEVACLTYPDKDFRYLNEDVRVYPFVMYINSHDKVYYHSLNLDTRLSEHMQFVCKKSRRCLEFNEDVSWTNVKTRLRRDYLENGRKNMDVRTGFKIGTSYLVKHFFSFGTRTVEPGEAHVYQLLDAPLLFYTVGKNSRLPRANKLLPLDDMHRYEKKIMMPNEQYRVPAGTTYIVLSLSKTLFRMDRVPENAPLPFETKNILLSKVRRFRKIYDRPVQTPYIEHGSREEQDPVPSSTDGPPSFSWLMPHGNGTSVIYIQQSPMDIPIPPAEPATQPVEIPVESMETLMEPVETPVEPAMQSVETLVESPMEPTLPQPWSVQKTISIHSPEFIQAYYGIKSQIYDRPPAITHQRTESPPLDLSTHFGEIDTILNDAFEGEEIVKEMFPDLMFN